MKLLAITLLTIAAGLSSGCAGTASSSSASGERAAPSGNGVTVFGTIDAGVSRYEKK